MNLATALLSFHTLGFWIVTVMLHAYRKKLTVIPLYGWLAALVVLTHVLSSFGLQVTDFDVVFLISSTAYFTPLLLGVFLLYVFDGAAAARKAILIIVMVSLLQLATVFWVAVENPEIPWIAANLETIRIYFFSVLAMVIDMVVMAMLWELVRKVFDKWFMMSVSLVLFGVFVVDTFVFATGVFAGSGLYWTIVKANLLVRLVLSLLMGGVIGAYLRESSYAEEEGQNERGVLDIVTLRSVEKEQITNLKGDILHKEKVNRQLNELKTKYSLALEGIDAGIWEWDVKTGSEEWSPRFYEMLGMANNEVEATLDKFLELLHPEDKEECQRRIEAHFREKKPFLMEYRLRTKNGEYKWFSGSGQAKFDEKGEPVRMVGSIIDIDERKKLELELGKKIEELSKVNKLMVGRELKMVELKKQIKSLGGEVAMENVESAVKSEGEQSG